jgi:hypothetical protein
VADMSSQVDDLVTLMIVFLSLLAVAAALTLFRPLWRTFKLVYHRKVPRLHRGEPLEKLWRLVAKTALSALYGAGFLLFLSIFLILVNYLYQSHESMLLSTVACSRDPGSFDWKWLAVIVPLALLYCLIPLTSAWVTPLKRHLFRRNRLYWIADQPIYVRNGSFHFNRRDEDERDPKIVTYDDYITNLKEALIRKDASLDEINIIRERMNVVLESLAGCLSERIMENDGKDDAEPRLSYLRSTSRGKFSRRQSSDMELDEYPTFRSSTASLKSQRR